MGRLDLASSRYYLNRHVQWLEFNRRSLEEARDIGNPLLGRVKFLAITANTPGLDGVTFQAIEAEGLEKFLDQLREELVQRRYRPRRLRKVRIPKEGGKTRQLSIPCIRDRVVQGALKLILEPIFEADFQPGSYGYRPKKTAHAALRRVSEAILRHLTYVVDFDLRSYFDTVRHHLVLQKVARRVSDADVLGLLKLLLEVSGKQGVPQGGVITPRTQKITSALSAY